MKEKALNLLGLMRKANAAAIGETDTGAAARAQTAKLVVLASDASSNAQSRANGFVHGRDIPLITLPFTKQEISEHVGKSGCSMAAICDLGFADAFLKLLCELDVGYADTAKAISERLENQKQRKLETKAHEKNKRTGKRRTNA